MIGGETAEMPGLYAEGDYDLAGFAVGAVERDALLPRKDLEDRRRAPRPSLFRRACQRLLARAPRGRAVWAARDRSGAVRARHPARPGSARADAHLCAPAACIRCATTGAVKALAHITGGGLTENLPRVLPDSLAAEIDLASFPLPPVFVWLQGRSRDRRRRDAEDLQLRDRHGCRRCRRGRRDGEAQLCARQASSHGGSAASFRAKASKRSAMLVASSHDQEARRRSHLRARLEPPGPDRCLQGAGLSRPHRAGDLERPERAGPVARAKPR